MVQSWVSRDLIKRPTATRLGIISTPHKPADASIHQSPRTHGTRFQGHHQGAVRQSPTTKDSAGQLKRQKFRMTHRIAIIFSCVGRLGDDLTISMDHGPHGYFTLSRSGSCQIQGSLHHDSIEINTTRTATTAPAPTVPMNHEASSSASERETPSP
jgi:hypothetical protein